MKTKPSIAFIRRGAALLLFLILGLQLAFAQDTAFTYQGRLNDGGGPVNGNYDLTFTLFGQSSGGNAIAGPFINSPTGVTNGLFTVTLSFGPGAFPGAARWLEIGVRTNGAGTFTVLNPRQLFTAAPYSIHAADAATATTATRANSVASNAVNNAALQNSSVDSAKIADGSISAGDLSATVLSNTFWRVGGNAGTTPGTHFIGTSDNQPLELKVSGGRALRLEPNTSGAPNLIGGPPNNSVADGVAGAVIAGGGALDYFGQTFRNVVGADFGVIGGGYANEIESSSSYSTIDGGSYNSVRTNSAGSVIGGGYQNTMQSAYSAIAGGYVNTIEPDANVSTIGGGEVNTIQLGAHASTIGGGSGNRIQPNADQSTIGGGAGNTIEPNAYVSTIAGGGGNTIQTNAHDSTIGGGAGNTIQTGANDSTIGGGNFNMIQTSSARATIGGGYGNTIQPSASYSTIGGGYFNTIQTNAVYSMIGGGTNNTIQTGAGYSTIGGGRHNGIQLLATHSTIGGGFVNLIQTNAHYSAIGGGIGNTIQTEAYDAMIGGGDQNKIERRARDSTIGGGYVNTIQFDARSSTIGGGSSNTIAAGSRYATVPGGFLNTVTNQAFAAGTQAKANHAGAFVWGDSTLADIASASNDSVTMRASGGYRLFSNSGATAGVSLAPGGTAWGVISDRNVKKDFSPVDGRKVLEKLAAVPVSQWHYQWEETSVTPHLGPMAQDFKAAFYPGRDDKTITTQEADGVMFAAIQGLNQKVESENAALRAELKRRDAENADLKVRLSALEKLLSKLHPEEN